MGRNKALKALSLLLALALWFAVSGEERAEITLNVSLELVNLRQNLMVTSEVPPALQVRVLGPRSIINKLSQTRVVHTLDLADYKSGRHSFSLGPNSFSFPRGVQVTRISPNPVNLTLATTMTRTLPVKPVLEGNPPEGYEVVSAETRPLQVTVKGPFPELSDLKYIATLPIDLTSLTEHTIVATDLDFKNLHLTLKETVPILADIKIASKIITRTITGVPVTAAPQSAKLSPAQVAITIKGPWHQVKEFKTSALKPVVNTNNLAPGRHRLNISVELPPGLSLVRVKPESVQARVAKSS